jgi:hypothetical protein
MTAGQSNSLAAGTLALFPEPPAHPESHRRSAAQTRRVEEVGGHRPKGPGQSPSAWGGPAPPFHEGRCSTPAPKARLYPADRALNRGGHARNEGPQQPPSKLRIPLHPRGPDALPSRPGGPRGIRAGSRGGVAQCAGTTRTRSGTLEAVLSMSWMSPATFESCPSGS